MQTVDQVRPRVIILHGAHGGPDTNWFPWLHAELDQRGADVVRPRLPTPEGQSLGAWFEAYDTAAPSIIPARTILVGHSLGAAFALRVVERSAEPHAGLFLAAGFVGALGLPSYDPINASFFGRPFDWEGIRRRAGECRCWAGLNDPYVPLARSREIADRMNAPLEVVADGGHLNQETGFTTFPHLRDAIFSALEIVASHERS